MKFNNFSDTSNPVSIQEIQEAEMNMGLVFPEEMKNHYLQFNGGFPENDYWKNEDGEFRSIHGFIPIKYASENRGCIEEVYKKLITKNLLPKALIPFARDPGGNFFCVDKNGSIYFYTMDDWDDELSDEENQKEATTLLCDSFLEFVNNLASEKAVDYL